MWKNTRVLVTGADGFIGSHLVEALLQVGAKVRALSLYNSFNSWGWLDGIENNEHLEVVTGDVRDPYLCQQITKDVDVVFHLAALIAIPYSYQAPASYIDTNVTGTLNMLQAARVFNCRRFVQTSTSEVYGTACYVPIDEKHPLQPQSPYSASKIGADSLALSFYHTFALPLTIARPFNTYGPRQSARAVIPSIISQIGSGRSRIMVGDLSPTRDFNYVLDTCQAFIKIAECDGAVGETINIGTGKEISVEGLFGLIRELMGKEVEFVQEEARMRPAGSEVRRLLCNNAKLLALTGFTHQHLLEDGLKQTIEWFSDERNLQKYKADRYNV